MAKGVEKLCEGAWLEVGLGRPGWFMTGSGGWVKKKVGEGRYRSRSPESDGQNTHAGEWQRGADLKRVVGAWVSRVCGSQGGQDKSCMTEGVERDIADDSKGGFLGLCWMAEGGGRRRPRGQSTKQTSASTQEPGQWGGGGGSKT